MEAFYKQYFSNLVSLSKQLQAFYYINDKYNLEAFDNAVKNMAATPALLLDQYDYELADTGSRNYFKALAGQFTILSKTDKGDQSTIEAAYVTAEQLCDAIVARMLYDFGDGGSTITIPDGPTSSRVLYKVKAKVQRVGPIGINGNYYGATCIFPWQAPQALPVTSDYWTDI